MNERLIESLERRLAVFEKIMEENPFEPGKIGSYDIAQHMGRIQELRHTIKVLKSPTLMAYINGEMK